MTNELAEIQNIPSLREYDLSTIYNEIYESRFKSYANNNAVSHADITQFRLLTSSKVAWLFDVLIIYGIFVLLGATLNIVIAKFLLFSIILGGCGVGGSTIILLVNWLSYEESVRYLGPFGYILTKKFIKSTKMERLNKFDMKSEFDITDLSHVELVVSKIENKFREETNSAESNLLLINDKCEFQVTSINVLIRKLEEDRRSIPTSNPRIAVIDTQIDTLNKVKKKYTDLMIDLKQQHQTLKTANQPVITAIAIVQNIIDRSSDYQKIMRVEAAYQTLEFEVDALKNAIGSIYNSLETTFNQMLTINGNVKALEDARTEIYQSLGSQNA